jgi:Outer membrane protein Omp28
MKALNVLILLISITLFSCDKKEEANPIPENNLDPLLGCTDKNAKNFKPTAMTDDCSCTYDFASTLSNSVPTEGFTQKVLIEEHSGTWCGWCPLSKESIEKLIVNKNVIGVEIHYNDKLTVLDNIFIPLKNVFGYPAWPSGMVNRKKSVVGSTTIMSESDWAANIDNILKKPKNEIGIGIDSKIIGNDIQILTQIKFKTAGIAEKYGIGIYLIENDVTGYPQINYLSKNTQFKQYKAYTLPGEIQDIKHYNVARAAISPIIGGFIIPEQASKKLSIYKKLFVSSIPQNVVVQKNCKIVAFIVNEKNEIQNVNYCDLGSKAEWN